MSDWPLQKLNAAFEPAFCKATWIILLAASFLSAVWLWSCWCSFPAIPWNDVRVAPAVALHHGISVYSSSTSGPVSTWTYGPLPLLLMWPAGFAPTAIGAIEIAGAIHIGLTVLALTLICMFWPASRVPKSPSEDMQNRLAAALLCVLLVRNQTSGYVVYCADAPGISLGLFALLALVRRHYWAAALFAASAAACKQTLIGVGIAQFAWLFAAESPRAAWYHLWRCTVAGAAIALAAVGYFGAPGLWYIMVELPSRFPWAHVPVRISEHIVYLIIHVALPIVVLLIWRPFFFHRNSPGLLPAVAFFCTLPFSLAGFLKIGGNVNSLHSFWLWFPATLIAIITTRTFTKLGRVGSLGLAMTAAALSSRWLQISPLRVWPNIHAYREAVYLAERLPKKIWFPLHPLVTLYSDGRLYHDIDGLGVRTKVGERLSDEHFFAHIPLTRQVSATLLPVGWGLADLADARLPTDTPAQAFGLWRVDGTLK